MIKVCGFARRYPDMSGDKRLMTSGTGSLWIYCLSVQKGRSKIRLYLL